MVKITIKGNESDTEIKGDLVTVTAECAVGISSVYNTFKIARGETIAEAFRRGLMAALEPGSRVWEIGNSEAIVIDKNGKKSDTPTDQS